MLFKEYLVHRKSIREYSNKALESSVLEDLKGYIQQIESLYTNDEMKFSLLENGDLIYEKLNGYAGYSGVMIKSPYYLSLTINQKTDEMLMKAAYSMQAIIKKINDLGLGTCWIDVSKVPEYIGHGAFGEKHPDYLISLGMPKKSSIIEMGDFRYSSGSSDVRNDPYSGLVVKKGSTSGDRKSIEEIVYLKEYGNKISIEEIEQRGLEELFSLVRNAPSTKNAQPWRFIINGSSILMAVLNPSDKSNIIDAGIMMYFFEGMAHDIGIRGEWSYITGEVKSYKDQEYAILGEFGV